MLVLCLACFTSAVFQLSFLSSMYHSFMPYDLMYSIVCPSSETTFAHLSVDGHLSCFLLLAIVKNVAVT